VSAGGKGKVVAATKTQSPALVRSEVLSATAASSKLPPYNPRNGGQLQYVENEACVFNNRRVTVSSLFVVFKIHSSCTILSGNGHRSEEKKGMKLFAFRDRLHDPEKEFGRYHALDLYSILATTTEMEWKHAIEIRDQERDDPYIVEAGRLVSAHFSALDHLGMIRLRESPYYRAEL
jgi:hypothetical protein